MPPLYAGSEQLNDLIHFMELCGALSARTCRELFNTLKETQLNEWSQPKLNNLLHFTSSASTPGIVEISELANIQGGILLNTRRFQSMKSQWVYLQIFSNLDMINVFFLYILKSYKEKNLVEWIKAFLNWEKNSLFFFWLFVKMRWWWEIENLYNYWAVEAVTTPQVCLLSWRWSQVNLLINTEHWQTLEDTGCDCLISL